MHSAGQIVTPSGVVPGVLTFADTIHAVTAGPAPTDRFILPGFIDPHVHGGDGGDTMDGVPGIERLARFHLRHGTTTLLPTTMTRPWAEVMDALSAVRTLMGSGVEGGARIHGAHLEGPFINPHRLGAQPPFAIAATPAHVQAVLGLDVVRVVTLACEMPGAEDAIRRFARAGVRVSLGHSAADYPAAAAALNLVQSCGCIACGTHLFNAMGGIEGRSPGLAGALLASRHAFAELILDLHHVHPGAFQLARAALGARLMLITDAMRATGLGDGESELGGQKVVIAGGVARLTGGALAGSVLTLDAALRHAIAAGATLVEASQLTSGTAAAYLGLADRGAIAPGKLADFVVLDAALAVSEVWVGGVRQV